jgi:hypothetical protein
MQRFLKRFNGSVLDVGGRPSVWEGTGVDVTVLNVAEPAAWDAGSAHFVRADARRMPFGDGAYGVAYCNSVIEHLGSWPDQERVAREVRRVARGYWVQTPAKCFPVEPHFLTPFFHWLPRSLQRRLLPYTIWALVTRPDRDFRESMANEIRLVSRGEMARLFPDGRIEAERVFGFTKSWIAVREADACAGGSAASLPGRQPNDDE